MLDHHKTWLPSLALLSKCYCSLFQRHTLPLSCPRRSKPLGAPTKPLCLPHRNSTTPLSQHASATPLPITLHTTRHPNYHHNTARHGLSTPSMLGLSTASVHVARRTSSSTPIAACCKHSSNRKKQHRNECGPRPGPYTTTATKATFPRAVTAALVALSTVAGNARSTHTTVAHGHDARRPEASASQVSSLCAPETSSIAAHAFLPTAHQGVCLSQGRPRIFLHRSTVSL